jgi:hypothetical protein
MMLHRPNGRASDPKRRAAALPVETVGAADMDGFGRSLPWPEFRDLHGYWASRRRGKRLPGRADIDPLDLPGLLPGIFLVDVLRGAGEDDLTFRFRLVGTAHLEINQVEITGMTLEKAFSPARLAPIRLAYMEVVAMRSPLLTTGLRAAVDGRCHVLFDRLLLPLASDGATVDMLLGHLRHQRVVE